MNSLFERVYAKSLEGEGDYKKPVRDVYKFAQNYFKRNFLDRTFKTKEGRDIKITERGFKELFFSIAEAMRGGDKGAANVFKSRADDENYWYDVLSIVVELDDIIGDMDFEYQKPNYKQFKKPDIEKYVTFSSDVELDGENHTVMIRVEVPHEGKPRYYFHYID